MFRLFCQIIIELDNAFMAEYIFIEKCTLNIKITQSVSDRMIPLWTDYIVSEIWNLMRYTKNIQIVTEVWNQHFFICD